MFRSTSKAALFMCDSFCRTQSDRRRSTGLKSVQRAATPKIANAGTSNSRREQVQRVLNPQHARKLEAYATVQSRTSFSSLLTTSATGNLVATAVRTRELRTWIVSRRKVCAARMGMPLFQFVHQQEPLF